MKLKTNKLLLISVIIIGLVNLAALFWEPLGMTAEETSILALILTLAFGINIAGLILSFSKKNGLKKV